MNNSNLSETQSNILMLIAAALFDKNIDRLDCDWQTLRKESYDQAVFLIVYSVVSTILPTSEQEAWMDLAEKIAAKNMTTNYEHFELHELMQNHNIKYTTIKGSGSASYYPDPLKRMMGDVDFIVKKDDLEKASEILESVGFHCVDNNTHSAHLAYQRDCSTWELHFSFGSVPNNSIGELIRYYLSDVIDKSYLYSDNGVSFYMPCMFHHGLIMLIHTANHSLITGIGLRHLCDWAVFVDKIPDEIFLMTFEEKLKPIGLWYYACILTLVSEKYLGLRHCSWTDSIESPSDELLEKMLIDIFAGGNFGVKDKKRIIEHKYIADSNMKNIGSISLPRQIVRSLNLKTKKIFPISVKYPVLIPIGYLYTLIWYVIMILKQNRPSANPFQIIKNSQERRNLYKEFKLFEVDE